MKRSIAGLCVGLMGSGLLIALPPAAEAGVTTGIAVPRAPAPPVAVPVTSTGVGTDQQSTGILAASPPNAVSLVENGTPVQFMYTDAGFYSATEDGALTFSPQLGFSGTAPPVTYRITRANLTYTASTYTATVTKPPVTPAENQTSSAPRGQSQYAVIYYPYATLVRPGGAETTSIVVAGQGTYGVSTGDGSLLTFDPAPCFVGTAQTIRWRGTDFYEQDSDANYTATVTAGDPPVATPLTTSGVGTAPQTATAGVSCGATVRLLDGASQPVTSLTRTGEGTYSVVPSTGVIRFVPAVGYSGTPAPVSYRITDPQSQTDVSTFTPTVTAPAAPDPAPRTTSGEGTATQSLRIPVPEGGSVAFLDGSQEPTTSLAVPGVGTYVLNPTTGAVSFVPTPGYLGTPAAVRYRVTDAYNQSGDSTYTPTVTRPAPPATPMLETTGPIGEAQERRVVVPTGGSVTLLDAAGTPVTSVTVDGEGTYELTPATGVITFTPVRGFLGTAAAVRYRVTDSYGQSATGRYAPVVTRAAAPAAGRPRVTAPRLVRSATKVPATCRLSRGNVTACAVTAYVYVNGRPVVAGRGRTVLHGRPGLRGRRQVVVPVRLNGLGRTLAARPHGVRLGLTAAVRQARRPGVRYDQGASRVVTPTVRLRPVYFATDSARLRGTDRRYLGRVHTMLAGVRRVTCTGFTDGRSTVGYNATLARRRAVSACARLVQGRRIRVSIISHGERRPSHTNASAHGRALNRRAQVVLRY